MRHNNIAALFSGVIFAASLGCALIATSLPRTRPAVSHLFATCPERTKPDPDERVVIPGATPQVAARDNLAVLTVMKLYTGLWSCPGNRARTGDKSARPPQTSQRAHV